MYHISEYHTHRAKVGHWPHICRTGIDECHACWAAKQKTKSSVEKEYVCIDLHNMGMWLWLVERWTLGC